MKVLPPAVVTAWVDGTLGACSLALRRRCSEVADFFLDIFNVLNDQSALRIQDLLPGLDGFRGGDNGGPDGVTFAEPRRYFVGARLRF